FPTRRSSDLSKLPGDLLFQDAENLGFAHDQKLLTVQLNGAARVLTEHDDISDLQRQGTHFAIVEHAAGADRNDLTLGGLFSRFAGQHDATSGFGLFFLATHDNTIV